MIGREQEEAALVKLTQMVDSSKTCRAIYFEAEGGLGKTRLLEDYYSFIHPHVPNVLVVDIIDLVRFEDRSPERIEQRLIRGLKQTNTKEAYRLPREQVNEVFKPYTVRYEEFLRHHLSQESKVQELRRELRTTFVSCWNQLSTDYVLAIRFDTVEALFKFEDPPQRALVHADEASPTERLVTNWMRDVLPRLHRTAVILSGRPLISSPDHHPLITALRNVDVLAQADIHTLGNLKDIDTIRKFLLIYDASVPEYLLSHIEYITDGRPLLLTFCAEALRTGGMFKIPLYLENISSTEAFENKLLSVILDPLLYDGSNLQEYTLIHCLYFLTCARRGLRRRDFYHLFEQLGAGHPPDPGVINSLHQLALVKLIRVSGPLANDDPAASVDLAPDDELLTLHDEIYILLDRSGVTGGLEFDETTYLYMSEISRKEVLSASDHIARLTAMISHMYYDMQRDPVQFGYRTYTIYMDWLLNERNVDDAILLSDAFWSTLLWSVHRFGEPVQPLYNKLRESLLELDDILDDEQVRRLKLLRARDQVVQALKMVDTLHQELLDRGTILPDDQPGMDPYIFVDFTIVRMVLLIQHRPEGYAQRVEQLADRLIELLEALTPPLAPSLAPFVYLRRWAFLGLVYTMRGQLRRQQRRYKESIADYESARRAYQAYQDPSEEDATGKKRSPEDILNDRIGDEIGQVTNNLAFALALSGDIRRALRLLDEIRQLWMKYASPYHCALFNITNASIRIRFGHWPDALELIQAAEAAANESGRNRARGMVLQVHGQYEREAMKTTQKPRPEAEHFYQDSETFLKDDNAQRALLYYDWAGFARDIGVIYRQKGNDIAAQEYFKSAEDKFDRAIGLSQAGRSMERVDLLESKAAIYVEMDDYDRAEATLQAAEEMMPEEMPEYGQVICGKIVLQRGLINIYKQVDYQGALRDLAIGLARAYIFAPEHRDQIIFERLIERRFKQIPEPELREFRRMIQSGQVQVLVEDLPYQRPDPSRWNPAWQTSLQYINDLISARLSS